MLIANHSLGESSRKIYLITILNLFLVINWYFTICTYFAHIAVPGTLTDYVAHDVTHRIFNANW